MRKFLGVIGVASLTVGPAVAADLPVKAPAYVAPVAASWTGFYVGGDVGLRGASARAATQSIFQTPNGEPTAADTCDNGSNCFFDEHLNSFGFRGGVFVGYNWQVSPAWLVGVEGDWGWANQHNTITGMVFPGGPFLASGDSGDSFQVRSRWDASARARLGYLATPSTLFYLTAGAAWLNFDATATCGAANEQATCFPLDPPPFSITSSATKAGWTVGAGIETLLWSNWFVRAEYRYADFGNVSFADSIFAPRPRDPHNDPTTTTATFDVHMQTHTALFGIGYRFGNF
jgi:outer membrane immunogenic protein